MPDAARVAAAGERAGDHDAVARDAAASARDIAVSARGVSMEFNGFRAVKDASFDLRKGRFLTILGPSASGKTTLLRMIAGFQKPSGGEIFINGQAVSAVPPHKRSIVPVFPRM